MKKAIFIGKTGCGKTTLCQSLNKLNLQYRKTQAIELYDNSIDTPGEYIENRSLYRALIVTAADADVIALVYDCTEEEGYIPPGFGAVFPKDIIGIITKVDLAYDEQSIIKAEERLKLAGATKIFKVNTLKGEGIEELLQYLK